MMMSHAVIFFKAFPLISLPPLFIHKLLEAKLPNNIALHSFYFPLKNDALTIYVFDKKIEKTTKSFFGMRREK
jgi:hypothetical protein